MSEPIKIETKFKDGEIVWAKVKGHPWWPGMVLHFLINSESKYKFNFFP